MIFFKEKNLVYHILFLFFCLSLHILKIRKMFIHFTKRYKKLKPSNEGGGGGYGGGGGGYGGGGGGYGGGPSHTTVIVNDGGGGGGGYARYMHCDKFECLNF
jgi:hypothetical protein